MGTENLLQPLIKKNDKLARLLIGIVSILIFIAVVLLGRIKMEASLGFDVHVFAKANAK